MTVGNRSLFPRRGPEGHEIIDGCDCWGCRKRLGHDWRPPHMGAPPTARQLERFVAPVIQRRLPPCDETAFEGVEFDLGDDVA